jgi:TetR/AcrR family acrAB operon transcriptional repressor
MNQVSGTGNSTNRDREERILRAASNLIAHYGYDKTTVSDIAREAGISKGAVYLHFASKEDLFEALLRSEILDYSQRWVERIEADPDGGSFVGLYRHGLATLNESPFMIAVVKRDQRILGSYLRSTKNIFRESSVTLRYEFVKIMQEAGAIRAEVAPEIIAHIMNMLSYGLISMNEIMDADRIPPFDAVLEGIGTLLDRALRPEVENPEAGKAIIRQTIQAVQQMVQQNTPPEQ